MTSTTLTERFDHAFQYAHDLHRDQLRKGPDGIPYVSHLLGVTGIVLEMGGSENAAIAALLHDTVEDVEPAERRDAVRTYIRDTFGDGVAEAVAAATEDVDLAEGEEADEDGKPHFAVRKQSKLAKLHRLEGDGLLVTIADKLHNARTILMIDPSQRWERFRKTVDGELEPVSYTAQKQRWWYSGLSRALASHRSALDGQPLAQEHLDEFVRVVEQLFEPDGLLPEGAPYPERNEVAS